MLNFVNIVLSRYKLEESTFKIIHSTSVDKKAWENLLDLQGTSGTASV